MRQKQKKTAALSSLSSSLLPSFASSLFLQPKKPPKPTAKFQKRKNIMVSLIAKCAQRRGGSRKKKREGKKKVETQHHVVVVVVVVVVVPAAPRSLLSLFASLETNPEHLFLFFPSRGTERGTKRLAPIALAPSAVPVCSRTL
jgi:hypothetical protein